MDFFGGINEGINNFNQGMNQGINQGMNLFPGVTPAKGQDEPPQEKKEAVVRRTSNPASAHGADLDTSSLRTHAPYTRAPQACPHLVSSGLMN